MSKKSSKAAYEISIMSGRQLVERLGTVKSITDKTVVFEYKKPRSSKFVIQVFPWEQVAAVYGDVGEEGAIYLFVQNEVIEWDSGTIKILDSGLVQFESEEEVATLNTKFVEISSLQISEEKKTKTKEKKKKKVDKDEDDDDNNDDNNNNNNNDNDWT